MVMLPGLQPPKDAKRESGSASTSAAQFAYVDPDLSWEDVAWIQKIAVGKPIVIKGISCVEVGRRALFDCRSTQS
jgi:isopentenyl diphosphate isomerase/L-lactate dehydrogenase-like FMN-dependent dehydrogenase